MDITELFRSLESNQAQAVEDVKIKFHEYLNATKESWLMNGLFDYYLASGSLRVVEILVGVREPHERYLFDRLSETLRGASKLQGLTLLGHIVRRNPTWLYKITQHNLIKELLKLLKFETDMLSVMSALLVIIVLLPMIAGFVAPLLQEIFEVFSRLASWNTNNPNKMSEGYLLHLQVGLYALFHRLYGMFPCNFLAYLRQEYSFRGDNHAIFSHTIKPMLETVKMHPLLVTASKDAETATGRWKKMEPHDVIVECAKFTVETTSNAVTATDNKPKDDSSSPHQHHSSSHCTRSSLECSGVLDGSYTSRGVRAHSSQLPSSTEKEIWTPNTYCGGATSPPDLSASAPTSIPHTPISQTFAVSSSFPQQEGTSPPEAAVEATPETTPVKDLRQVSRGPPSVGSSVVRALNSTLGPAGGSSPMHSQPSSPMKKETSPFRFPPDNCSAFQQLPRNVSTTANSIQSDHSQARRDSVLSQRVQRIILERIQITEAQTQEVKTTLKPKTPVSNSSASIIQPTSPLRVIPGAMLDRDIHQAPNSPLLMTEETQEDKEVETMMRGGNDLPMTIFTSSSAGRQCDSVLQEFHQHQHHDEEHVEVEGYEECQQETGSPCTSGGLHMPNSQSMRDFARQVNRLRYYSYNQGNEGNEPHIVLPSTRSSLSEGSSFPDGSNFRRAYSCPEMKKSISISTLSVGDQLPLDENEEDEEEIGGSTCVGSNGSQSNQSTPTINGHTSLSAQESMTVFHKSRKRLTSCSTQTENALPYEHLFLNVFPCIEQHHTPPPDSGTPSLFPNKTIRFSPYQAVETFINTTVHCYENKRTTQGIEHELKLCKDQLVLLNLQLQFERHRREVHAERNRRLLGKSRNNRALEEHNSALRDQVTLLQHDKDSIREELQNHRRDSNWKQQKLEESVNYWQEQSKNLQKACDDSKACCETLQQELKQEREKTATVTKRWNDTKAQLFDTCSELQQALNMLSAGREVREELQTLQREVVMGGELQLRCRDTLAHLARAVHHSVELSLHHDAYIQQVEAISEQLEVKNAGTDALRSRIAELETIVLEKNRLLSEQNRLLDKAQTDYNEQLQIAEKKHQGLRSMHVQLEEKIVGLHDQIETLMREKQLHQKQHNTVSSPQHNTTTLPAQPDKAKKRQSLSHLSGPDVQLPMRNFHGLVEDSELQASSVSAISPSSSDTFH